jgi:hypothetical protein
MGETMIQRRNAIKIIGAALLAPKVCFAQKQLLPETQMIIDTVNSWNFKNTKINFVIDEHPYKLEQDQDLIQYFQELVGIYFWDDDLQRADIVTWPIGDVDPVVVLKELAGYFDGKDSCLSRKVYIGGHCYTFYYHGLKVFIS